MRSMHHRCRSILGLSVALIAVGCAQEASAQAAMTTASPSALASSEGPPRGRAQGLRPPKVVVSPKAHALAAQITAEAQAHYDAGRFEDAAESYRRAFAVVPAPELLFNLGQCQRLLGRAQRAVKYFEAYLRLRPDAPHRALVEQLIVESKLIEPAPSAPAPPSEISAVSAPAAAPPSPPRHHINVMPLPPPEPLTSAAPTRLTADDRYSDRESPAVYERWWFWTAIAVVAAGAAVTTYTVVESQNDSEPTASLGMIEWD
jgi:tetratricopeptide (TPR) repeat protein